MGIEYTNGNRVIVLTDLEEGVLMLTNDKRYYLDCAIVKILKAMQKNLQREQTNDVLIELAAQKSWLRDLAAYPYSKYEPANEN